MGRDLRVATVAVTSTSTVSIFGQRPQVQPAAQPFPRRAAPMVTRALTIGVTTEYGQENCLLVTDGVSLSNWSTVLNPSRQSARAI